MRAVCPGGGAGRGVHAVNALSSLPPWIGQSETARKSARSTRLRALFLEMCIRDRGKAVCTGEAVCRDGRFTTGRGAGVAVEFGLALVEQLCGREAMEAVKASMAI